MGETRVWEIYDPENGETFGVAPNRYQAKKLADELRGCRIRRVWVKTIITNEPEKFAQCDSQRYDKH